MSDWDKLSESNSPPFRRVDDRLAGPNALGILVPPGQRTIVILRPRPLTWDLLPARWEAAGTLCFCDFARQEAAGIARQLLQYLEQSALEHRNPMEVQSNPDREHHRVWLRQSDLLWTACRRRPGKSYEAMVFPSLEEAQLTAEQTALYVNPRPGACQEYYFNTQHFAGSS